MGLKSIANEWRWLAVLWHGYFAVFILAVAFGWRPSVRIVGLFLALPLLAVSLLAWLQANPFNGAVFGVAAVVLMAIASRLPKEPVQVAQHWLVAVGTLMAGFGWAYPHFLVNAEPVEYLYAAPVGLIPCPTISIVLGLSLVLGGLGSRAWSLTVAFIGLFYGVFGAVGLGVSIDWALFVGAAVMLFASFSQRLSIVSAGGGR